MDKLTVTTRQAKKNGAFMIANKDEFRVAMSRFKERFTAALYLEYTSNTTGYTNGSARVFQDLYGMSDEEFQLAFTELVKLGYLVRDGESNNFDMYRVSQIEDVVKGNNDVDAQLYVIKMIDLFGEEFYKIGVTRTTLERRYSELEWYRYEVIKQYDMKEYEAYEVESRLEELGREYKYEPALKFGGETECYSCIDWLDDEIIYNVN